MFGTEFSFGHMWCPIHEISHTYGVNLSLFFVMDFLIIYIKLLLPSTTAFMEQHEYKQLDVDPWARSEKGHVGMIYKWHETEMTRDILESKCSKLLNIFWDLLEKKVHLASLGTLTFFVLGVAIISSWLMQTTPGEDNTYGGSNCHQT